MKSEFVEFARGVRRMDIDFLKQMQVTGMPPKLMTKKDGLVTWVDFGVDYSIKEFYDAVFSYVTKHNIPMYCVTSTNLIIREDFEPVVTRILSVAAQSMNGSKYSEIYEMDYKNGKIKFIKKFEELMVQAEEQALK